MLDTHTVLDLMVNAFKPGDAELRRIFTHDLTADPGCPPANRVVVMDGDVPAAALLVFERRLRLGAAVVPTACIGAVATDPARKGRGLGRKLMAAAHQRIRAMGLPWAFLIGIDHFYSRLGYRPCLVEGAVTVLIDHLPPAEDGGEAATAADEPALLALARAGYRDGAWMREHGPGTFAAQLARSGFTHSDIRLLRRDGRIVAWHLRQGGRLHQCAAVDPEAAAWVWRDTAARARAEDPALSELHADLPAGHPCHRVLTGRPYRCQTSVRSYGGFLGLVLDEAAFIAATAPELLARAAVVGRGGVAVRIGSTTHCVGDGAISMAMPDAGTLLTAVSGIGPAANLPIDGDPVLRDALFPVRGNGFVRIERF
jgi:GNAT superfamily N-acetyltransferase